MHLANLVYELIQEWELTDFVTLLCFDTTYVNSGHINGAGIRLERLLSKKLQFFPWRHHIYELVLRLVFEHFMGATKSDKVKLFSNFKAAWNQMDTKEYSCGTSDEKVAQALKPSFVKNIKDFIRKKLEDKTFRYLKFPLGRWEKALQFLFIFPLLRSDYKDFLELSLLFLGEELARKEDQVIFHPPGADHHARLIFQNRK